MKVQVSAMRCVVGLALAARVASGQVAPSSQVILSGGVTALTSESRELRKPGGHLQVGLARLTHSRFVSRVQIDAGYHSLASVAAPDLVPPNSSVWMVTASIVKDAPTIYGFHPYVIAGIGSVYMDYNTGGEVHLDLAGGGGVRFPTIGRAQPFIEGRYHRIGTVPPNRLIPVSFGVAFH